MLGLLLCLLASQRPELDVTFAREVAPLLEASCLRCHSGADAEGELRFEGFLDGSRPVGDVQLWRAVAKQLRSARMPPRKEPRPDQAKVSAALGWIDAQLALVAPTADPGRTTLRRLNRVEYENSVEALCGVRFDASAWFPPDESGYGFDSIGDVLSMPDLLLEKYVVAAERIAARAIVVADPDHPPALRIADERIVHTEKFGTQRGAWSLYSYGFVGVDHEFAQPGEYLLRVRAWAQQAGPEPARMALKLGTREVAKLEVTAVEGAAELYEARVEVGAGRQRFSVWFVNDFWQPDEPDARRRDRNLYVEWLEVAGPVGWAPESDFQRRLFSGDEPRDPRALVEDLAQRAWRRPVTRSEVDRLLGIAPRGAPREIVVRDALVALLSSPHFLFRVEQDPEGARPGSVRRLSDHELATRLSYFLWSTLPDERLSELARHGRLSDETVLEGEVQRMLRDARAGELVRNFAGQWLQLRALERAAPDRERFPGFDDELRAAMRAETELLFEAVLREGRPIRELLDPDFTFVNEALARHYGIEGVSGTQLRRVHLGPELREVRGGLLQQASMLTVTSNPTRTSPVKRGKWVLETLLGAPPLAPQPGVDSLDESPAAARAASLRERLAQHRADPKCAVCHDTLDPLGFALENYDPVGRWRTQADGFPVDATGELEDGTKLDGPRRLEQWLAGEPAFLRGLAEKLAIYALGRGLRPADAPAFDALVASFEGREPSLPELVLGVVRLEAFRSTVVADQP